MRIKQPRNLSPRAKRLQMELTPKQFDRWDERAAIMEYHGEMSREKAEEKAEREVR